ncbi:MAG: hypothetical protein JXL80_17300 [Planctomycetes bacterium]|nr:hypothetical protein [Planctomycetota bacterium]
MRSWLRRIRQGHPVLWRAFKAYQAFLWTVVLAGFVLQWLPTCLPLIHIVVATLVMIALGVVALVLAVGPLRDFSYYRVFLPLFQRYRDTHGGLFGRIAKGLIVDCDRKCAELILESQEFAARQPATPDGIYPSVVFGNPSRIPLVVRREHLTSIERVRGAAFSIVLLFNPIVLKRENGKYVMQVDLKGQSCAIYNNAGKQFLRARFCGEDQRREHAEKSHETHRFLMGDCPDRKELQVCIPGLRWVSGGFLPVAKWHGSEWVCLFFRDIHPIGWNLANGASENKAEYKDLDKLIYRETHEELVICGNRPRRDADICRRRFIVPGPETLPMPELAATHDRLRLMHDGIHFTLVDGPELVASDTRHRVEVSYHDDWVAVNPQPIQNVLLAINPVQELGIEVIRAGKFDLGDDDFLLDGEVHDDGTEPYLVRRPVLMLSVEFLKKRFAEPEHDSSLGPCLDDEESPDAKDLGVVDPINFHLFRDDIELRRSRMKVLEANHGDSENLELTRIRTWQNEVGKDFEDVIAGAPLRGRLARLLPATWKAIELAIRHKVL